MDIYVPDSNKVVHETSVDFVRRTLPNPVHVVQYDTEMPVVAVSLFRNGQTYTVIDGSTINIRFGKPDSTFVIKEVLGKNAAGNIVYFDVDPQMTIFHGTFHPIIEVIIDEQVAGSSALNIEIDRNPVPDSYVESTPEYHKLDEALEVAEGLFINSDAMIGILKNCLVAQILAKGGTATFSDIKVIDLGDRNWTKSSGFFVSQTGAEIMNAGADSICTKYKNAGSLSAFATKTYLLGNYYVYGIQIDDPDYVDAAAFKTAMKGVLLAYKVS